MKPTETQRKPNPIKRKNSLNNQILFNLNWKTNSENEAKMRVRPSPSHLPRYLSCRPIYMQIAFILEASRRTQKWPKGGPSGVRDGNCPKIRPKHKPKWPKSRPKWPLELAPNGIPLETSRHTQKWPKTYSKVA